MRNHVLEVLKRTTATVAIAAMLLCGVTACSSGGSTGGGSDDRTREQTCKIRKTIG